MFSAQPSANTDVLYLVFQVRACRACTSNLFRRSWTVNNHNVRGIFIPSCMSILQDGSVICQEESNLTFKILIHLSNVLDVSESNIKTFFDMVQKLRWSARVLTQSLHVITSTWRIVYQSSGKLDDDGISQTFNILYAQSVSPTQLVPMETYFWVVEYSLAGLAS